MRRCPCCNARLRERSICSRCKADLSSLIRCAQGAQLWLAKAIQFYLVENVEQSIVALDVSLNLKKSQVAVVFREFLIEQQCRVILDLLAQKQLQLARKSLYSMRKLRPYSKQLQQMYFFNDYLGMRNQDRVLDNS
ncbi:hypothetical protein BMR02_05000 [Methylococcaceae bacterium HT1]|nr:hypothetical protein BMR02_05000 [Methylococcaceae bacterium HT1]TXL17541.1 hypothetical protein BMR04_05150 [Methylococcaceae bacterium HT3]TXL22634.1 hypothetical protein BMR03_07125 [Methylococcaceae bacterium HT2]